MKIEACIIKFEGSDAAAQELLRMIGQQLGMPQPAASEVRVIAQYDSPVDVADAPLARLAKTTKPKGKPGRKPKSVAATTDPEADETDGDGVRYAPGNTELQDAIVDYVKLNGPTRVRDLAIAMQRAGQGIGKAVSVSDRLAKDDEGFVHVTEQDDE